jgi:hypothetical protein
MSRKDYELVARAFKDIALTATTQEKPVVRKLAKAIALQLALNNAFFDGDRFMNACGFEEGNGNGN